MDFKQSLLQNKLCAEPVTEQTLSREKREQLGGDQRTPFCYREITIVCPKLLDAYA